MTAKHASKTHHPHKISLKRSFMYTEPRLSAASIKSDGSGKYKHISQIVESESSDSCLETDIHCEFVKILEIT